MLSDVLDRIERRLAALGMSATEASVAAGLSKDGIRNMRRYIDSGRGMTVLTLIKLAPVLKTTPGWLIDGTGPEFLAPGNERLHRTFNRLAAAPEEIQAQVLGYAEGALDRFEASTETATTPES